MSSSRFAPGGTSLKWTCLSPGSTTIASVCITGPDPLAWAVHALSLPWKDLDPYAFSPVAILGKVAGLPVQQNHSDCPRVAQHALVLGPSGLVEPNPIVSAQPVKPFSQTLHREESGKPESPCLASRAPADKSSL